MSLESLVQSQLAAEFAQKKDVQIFDHFQLKPPSPDMITVNGVGVTPPQPGQFANLVEGVSRHATGVQGSLNNHPAPMQEASKLGGTLRVEDARQLGAALNRFQQSQQAQWTSMIDKVKNNPNLDLSPTVTKQLEMKMDNINRQFGRLNKSLNLPPSSANGSPFIESLGITTSELSAPLKTFFNFIAKGERQLSGLQTEINAICSSDNQMVNPATLLKLQLKMTHVSQQIELFTSMLNKGLESSKTVFNTQI